MWVWNVRVISLLILLKPSQVGYLFNKSLTRLYILIGVDTFFSTIPRLCHYQTCHKTRNVQLNMHFKTSATLFLRYMVTLHRFKYIYGHHGCVSSCFFFTSDWYIVFFDTVVCLLLFVQFYLSLVLSVFYRLLKFWYSVFISYSTGVYWMSSFTLLQWLIAVLMCIF